MRWRSRVYVLIGSVLLSAAVFAADPYWHSAVSSPDSYRGRRGRIERTEDTPARAAERALIGAACGAGVGLLLFIDGLEFPRRRRREKADANPRQPRRRGRAKPPK